MNGDQYGRGEQSAVRKRAVVLCLDHVVHRKSSGLYCECNVQLEYEGVATFLC